MKDNVDIYVDAPQVVHSFAAEFSLSLFLAYRSLVLEVDSMPEVEYWKPEGEKPSVKCGRSSSAMSFIALVSQSISTTDRLSQICKFVKCKKFD